MTLATTFAHSTTDWWYAMTMNYNGTSLKDVRLLVWIIYLHASLPGHIAIEHESEKTLNNRLPLQGGTHGHRKLTVIRPCRDGIQNNGLKWRRPTMECPELSINYKTAKFMGHHQFRTRPRHRANTRQRLSLNEFELDRYISMPHRIDLK